MYTENKPFKKKTYKKIDYNAPRKKPNHSANSYAMWLLSSRDYSARDLKDKLIKRGYELEETTKALEFTQEHQFQSDERYASSKAASKSRKAGNFRVKMELNKKGISEDIINEQIENLEPEEERAKKVIMKFSGKEVDNDMFQKIYRFMASRGFSSTSIKQAVAHLKENNKEI